MLTFDECKAVVEEVWGLTNFQLKEIYLRETHGCSFDVPFDDWTQEFVNSWEGFGLTVEAMEKRGWQLRGAYGGEIMFVNYGRAHPCPTQEVATDHEEVWSTVIMRDATHRAALEAVRREK